MTFGSLHSLCMVFLSSLVLSACATPQPPANIPMDGPSISQGLKVTMHGFNQADGRYIVTRLQNELGGVAEIQFIDTNTNLLVFALRTKANSTAVVDRIYSIADGLKIPAEQIEARARGEAVVLRRVHF